MNNTIVGNRFKAIAHETQAIIKKHILGILLARPLIEKEKKNKNKNKKYKGMDLLSLNGFRIL